MKNQENLFDLFKTCMTSHDNLLNIVDDIVNFNENLKNIEKIKKDFSEIEKYRDKDGFINLKNEKDFNKVKEIIDLVDQKNCLEQLEKGEENIQDIADELATELSKLIDEGEVKVKISTPESNGYSEISKNEENTELKEDNQNEDSNKKVDKICEENNKSLTKDYKNLEESLQRGAEILKKLDSDKSHNAKYFYGKDMRNEEIEDLNDIIDRNSHTIEHLKKELRKTLNEKDVLEFQNKMLKEELEQEKKCHNSDKYYGEYLPLIEEMKESYTNLQQEYSKKEEQCERLKGELKLREEQCKRLKEELKLREDISKAYLSKIEELQSKINNANSVLDEEIKLDCEINSTSDMPITEAEDSLILHSVGGTHNSLFYNAVLHICKKYFSNAYIYEEDEYIENESKCSHILLPNIWEKMYYEQAELYADYLNKGKNIYMINPETFVLYKITNTSELFKNTMSKVQENSLYYGE